MGKSVPDETLFVLIAEDDEAVRDLTATVLEDAGWEVRCASNGRDAVALFRSNCHRVAVVILDLMMPEMDGQCALQEIRRQCRDVPIIVVSGLDGRSVLKDSVAKTVFAFVQKPFRITDLVAIVHRAAEKHHGRGQRPGP